MAVTTDTSLVDTTGNGAEACCSPLTVDILDAHDAGQLAARFKAIADPVRLQILSRLAAAPNGVCVCDFVDDLDRSQPTISHHLKVLGDAGLVTREQRGKWAWSHIESAELETLADFLTPR
ncbi:MAG: metalloregulator ArsR/SmtB family transcription factor [Actinomycetota bacterium]